MAPVPVPEWLEPITNAVSAGSVDQGPRDDALAKLAARAGSIDADLVAKGGPSAARVIHDAAVELDGCSTCDSCG